MTRSCLATSVLIAIMSSWPSRADACDCVGPAAACVAVSHVDAVFVARVVSVDYEPMPTAHLAVVETFHGVVSALVTVPWGGSNCSYPFKAGETYLIYGSRTSGAGDAVPAEQLFVRICSRTVPIDGAADDLTYFRAIVATRPKTSRLLGFLSLREPVGSWGGPKQMPDVAVTATGDGHTYATVADARGAFELTGLPPGTYDVSTSAPGYLAEKQTVIVREAPGCGTASFNLQRVPPPRHDF